MSGEGEAPALPDFLTAPSVDLELPFEESLFSTNPAVDSTAAHMAGFMRLHLDCNRDSLPQRPVALEPQNLGGLVGCGELSIPYSKQVKLPIPQGKL